MDVAFGEGSGTVSRTLDKSLGFPTGPLLAVAAPMVLNLVKKSARAQNLDAKGVASMLQGEAKAFIDKAGPRPTSDELYETWFGSVR